MNQNTIILELKINTAYPTAATPRHRFEKQLHDAPWSGVISATVELDDPVWELLGYPRTLKVTLEAENPKGSTGTT